MQKAGLFQQYLWLLQTIYQANGISFENINKRWVRDEWLSGGVEMHRNTFNRHKRDIEEIFNINIVCDKVNGFKYHIENLKDLTENHIFDWLLSSIAVHTAVQKSASLQDRILLEEIPSGQIHLPSILEAMKANLRINFTYQKYGEEPKPHTNVAPWCLKLYKQRWFVCAPSDGGLHTYSLDRIQTLDITQETFEIDPNFDAKEHFKHCYGVFRDPKVSPQKVVLRAFGKEKYYLRDLPLHLSQKEIGHGPNYADFSYYLNITEDFIGEILRQGDWLKVLEPQSLQDKVIQKIKDMQKNYTIE